MPLAIDLAPIAGRLPLLVGNGCKTIHQPERRRRIAAVRHEGEPLGIGDKVARKTHRTDKGTVGRFLVVEVKGLAGMPDAVDALVDIKPFVPRALRSRETP